ncbi:PREDICTED: putative nuclease HARBI1 isoform X2 [Acropora digitifera]|uniref:putative nuclease HARBI1 isoform X2 n=1 Tax=Acropora digitifera TaxID=70779 RepID=UPI00077AD918|nr:PREDICTED: putative nuclease HARBI1 isoform X2 [Acropora digitifera]
MADLGSLFFAFESQDDSHLLGDMLEDSDEVIILSAVCCFMRRNLTRIQDYFEQTLPRYLPDEFKHHFRMTRETCELLSLEIMQTGQIPIRNSSGRPVIAPQKQILAFLWRIANQEPARAVADRFDLTYSSVDRVFRRVVLAAVSLCGQYIKWPTGNQMPDIKSSFEEEGGFPGIIGVVDGTHIRIRAPEQEPEAYINRKKFHSINVQLVAHNTLQR